MKIKVLTGIVTVILITILFSSCSKLPQAEIDAANTAIDDAKLAGADIYETENFITLKDSMKSVMEGLEATKSKFIKSYGSSKDDLAGVAQFAETVKQQTIARKEELKVGTQAAITEITSLLAVNNQLILEAPKGKEGTSALVAIKGELETIKTAAQDATVLLEAGDYLAAFDKATAANEKAAAIQTELQDVINKYKSNAKK